jgi:replicative DNA helicase
LLGYPTGFATIDQATEGLQGGQLVSLVASPKVGKSTLMVVIAAHLHDQGHSVMLQSFEMSNREQQERHDAIRAKVSLKRLRKGTLTPAEEQRYQTMLGSLTTMSPLVLSDSQHGVTVSALAARVARLDPDVVFVDGVYFMIDEVTGESGTAQSLTNITRALKRVAQRLDKPIVLSTQALLWKMRKGKTSEGSIGYSSSFLQDSDVILGLDKEDGVDDRRTLKIIASRNCPTTEVDLDWDWDNGRFVEQTSFVPGSTSPSSSGSSAPAAPTDLYGLGT